MVFSADTLLTAVKVTGTSNVFLWSVQDLQMIGQSQIMTY